MKIRFDKTLVRCEFNFLISGLQGTHGMTTEPAGMSIDVPGALDSFSADQLGDIDRIEEITGSPKKPISNNETEAVATEGTVAGLATNNDYVSQETGTVVRARLFCLSEEETWEDLTTGIFVLENDYVP